MKTVDKDFRPRSYFDNLAGETLVLSSIVGEERRKAFKGSASGAAADNPLADLTDGNLDDEKRTALGTVHPAFMGGEYLPPVGQEEIEIARVVFQSVTQDVISIRAARKTGAIAYRIVTEYQDEDGLGIVCPIEESREPLTLQEMIDLIQKSNETYKGEWNYPKQEGLIFGVVRINLDNGADPDDMKRFVSVQSEFYPQLEDYFARAVDEFIDSVCGDDS